jgi:FAD/FMN-containing dehydrogenase/Fe-S oxidoreductase
MANVSLPVIPSIADDLRRLDIGGVRFDQHNRQLYSTDASLYQVTPIGVVMPRDINAVPAIVNYCAARKIALVPRGGGTSLAGQCTANAIVMDLTPSCRGLINLSIAEARCSVEAGISIDEVNRQLAARDTGLFFAPDPATAAQASVGGCIGNNAAGARSIRYGRTSENLHGIEVVLSSGDRLWLRRGAGRDSPVALALAKQVGQVVRENADEIRRRFPKLVRRNAGYGLDLILQQLDRDVTDEDLDLSGLICGSEGTLAVVVAAELALNPVPRARGLAVLSFSDLESAIGAVCSILPTRPSAVELLDEVVIRAAEGNAQTRPYVTMLPRVNGQTPQAVLYVEYQTEDASEHLAPFFTALRGIVPDAVMAEFIDPSLIAQAWTLRKSAEALLHGLPGKAKPVTFVEDNSVPVEQLGRFIDEFKAIVTRHGTQAAYYAHASVGVLHVRPMIDLHSASGRAQMQSIAIEIADLAKRSGGVMSGEHGDGRVRGPLLADFYGPQITAAFKRIKNIFDPAGILNPGNIVEAGAITSITANLRVDAELPSPDVNSTDTFFEYPGEAGFAGAVELCNGAGFCRKTAGGTMCPSYRGTLDERHSTRGRGNAIRLAVTGQTVSQWNDPAVIQTLDLCLGCKACKTECPSSVDLAQLKSEYDGQRYRRQGAGLKARVFSNVRTLNRAGSVVPRLANWMGRVRPARTLLEGILNIAPQRSLPPFAPSLYKWFRTHRKTAGPRVALWADCFVTYSEPRIGQAATQVLEALGYSVELPTVGCCGRPAMSTGLMEQAIATADRTLQMLQALIDDPTVIAIVVFEPSCLSAMKDEWMKLKMRTDLPTRKRLAEKAMLFEDFIELRWNEHPVPPIVKSLNQDVIFHGHCHQKALWGVESTTHLLRRIVGDRLIVLPSGCCGMAGSFGYTKEHYELSMKIGELSVFPPIRAAEADAITIAPGTSCRHQIKDGTGRDALHPAELLARALPTSDYC